MFAIVDIAGFQEKVSEGEKLTVPTLKSEPGKTMTFEKVLLVANSDSDVKIGTPYVAGAAIEVKILEHGRAEKIRGSKMNRRKRYRRVYGHRQGYTEIEVLKIKAAGGAKKAAEIKAEAIEKKEPATKKAPAKKPEAKKEA